MMKPMSMISPRPRPAGLGEALLLLDVIADRERYQALLADLEAKLKEADRAVSAANRVIEQANGSEADRQATAAARAKAEAAAAAIVARAEAAADDKVARAAEREAAAEAAAAKAAALLAEIERERAALDAAFTEG